MTPPFADLPEHSWTGVGSGVFWFIRVGFVSKSPNVHSIDLGLFSLVELRPSESHGARTCKFYLFPTFLCIGIVVALSRAPFTFKNNDVAFCP